MSKNEEIVTILLKELFQDSSARDIIDTSSSSSSSDSEPENQSSAALHRVSQYYETTVQAYSDVEFKENFRLERFTFNALMTFLEPLVTKENLLYAGGRRKIPTNKKVLMTIYYLANQDCFRQVANLFHVSRSTAHEIVNYVVGLIFEHSPNSLNDQLERKQPPMNDCFLIKEDLRTLWDVYVDGSHIQILNIEGDNDYINRKGFSSILLQGVVNFKLEFIDVYCGEPGSMHDSRLLKKSGLCKKIEESRVCMYGYFLLGDWAYMSKDWLVPPFKDNGTLTFEERQFNFIHSSLRARVENAFGMLKGRFRRLRDFQNVNREFIIRATVAAIVLHNLCIREDDEVDDILTESHNQPQYFEPEDVSRNNRTSRRQQAFLQLFPNSH